MGAEHGPTQARETEVRLRRRWARASTTGRHSHPVQHFRVAHRCGTPAQLPHIMPTPVAGCASRIGKILDLRRVRAGVGSVRLNA